MSSRYAVGVLLGLVSVLPLWAACTMAPDDWLVQAFDAYETIRVALSDDTLEGVGPQAAALAPLAGQVGGDADRDAYLARTLGLVFTVALTGDGGSLLRVEVEEQSFRREAYRAARVGFVRRFSAPAAGERLYLATGCMAAFAASRRVCSSARSR